MAQPFGQPSMAKIPPGCRSFDLLWDECELDLVERGIGQEIIIYLRWANMELSRCLKKGKDGQIRCNLQELEVLRWIVESEITTEAAMRLKACDIQYLPQKRYSCLCATHRILELGQGMGAKELQEVGEEAIRDSTILLCPAVAPLCKESSLHSSVAEQVYKLAKSWPTRQILCATGVKGMIDICPVAICQNDTLRNGCAIFGTSRARARCLPTKVIPHEPLDYTYKQVDWAIHRGRNNPHIALHDSWHVDILSVAQGAVFRCQRRRANCQPTRLYDAHGGTTERGLHAEHYLALSYCWEEWPNDDEDALLKWKLKELSQRLGIQYFWVDRWCVNQNDAADKAREIPRMRDYYMGASGCVVLAGPEAVPFQCLPQHSGAILSAHQQILLNRLGIQALCKSKWGGRVWTVQEGLLSRQVVYAVQNQLIDGDFISELIAFIDSFTEMSAGNGESIGGYGSYRWNARAATVVHPRQFRMKIDPQRPQGPDPTRTIINDADRQCAEQQLVVVRSVFGGEQQFEELHSAGELFMPFEEALSMITGRAATKNEDFVYGVLGICEGEPKVTPEYDIPWTKMMLKLQKASLITDRQLASPTINEVSHMSWLPRCGSDYGPFRNIERLAAFTRRPKLSWSEQGAAVMGAPFRWEVFQCEADGFINIHGMSCKLVHGMISFPDTPGLVARVGGTSSQIFTPQRLEGLHVMLCEGIDDKTQDTVAIRVSGNIEDGHVCREDGYVLELHRWVQGDPKMLNGRQWIVGNI